MDESIDPVEDGLRQPDQLETEHFAIVPEWILGESAEVVKLYALLARHARKATGVTWPGQALLAKEMGVSDRSVRTWLTRLKEIGALVQIKRRYNGTTIHRLIRERPTGNQLPVAPEISDPQEATDRKPTSAPTGSQVPPNESHRTRGTKTLGEAEALAEVCKIKTSDQTASGRQSFNAALKELTDVRATPAEIRRRAVNWPYAAPLTPAALVKHWAALDTPPPAKSGDDVPINVPPPRDPKAADRVRKLRENRRSA